MESGCGCGTNNEAEYKALILALSTMIGETWTSLTVMLDSELVYRQMRGEWKVKNQRLRALRDLARTILGSLVRVELRLVRSADNSAHECAEEAMREEPSPYDGVEYELEEAAVWQYKQTLAKETELI